MNRQQELEDMTFMLLDALRELPDSPERTRIMQELDGLDESPTLRQSLSIVHGLLEETTALTGDRPP
jgi:hypothetical protein